MDGLKLFVKSEKELKSLIYISYTFSTAIRTAIRMQLAIGFQKCATVVMQRGKLLSSSGLILPDGLITTLTPLEYYKYLGIYEVDSINCPKTKGTVQTEYLRRLRKILSSQLHGRHKIMPINEFAIPVLQYSATITDWKKSE